jgi:hypothetical protein
MPAACCSPPGSTSPTIAVQENGTYGGRRQSRRLRTADGFRAVRQETTGNEPKESFASHIERREAQIALAMKQEEERHAAVIKNMHRLRALRLSQMSKA